MRQKLLLLATPTLLISLLILPGCATPDYQTVSRTKVISPDASDNLGGTGIESDDVRTIASRMTASLMSVPEIHFADHPVRIAISPVKNSTRFMIDNEIFTTRLRAEMNSISQGRVRFFAQDMAAKERINVLWERNRNRWDEQVDLGARKLLEIIRSNESVFPVKVVALESTTQNVEGIDADSVISIVRSRMAQESNLVQFLSRDGTGKISDAVLNESEARDLGLVEGDSQKFAGADFFLGGELIAQSLSTRTVAEGQEAPNETMVLNLTLTNASSGVVAGEVVIPIKERVTDGTERADYILTGEMRGLSKASAGGDRSDYILMSFQLIDIGSNELIWEDIYETKKVTNRGVLYK